MKKSDVCKSCSGPLDDYNKKEIIRDGFCPYCVDKSGNLKSYADVLTGMLEYIQSDHPEISEKDKVATANKWLREGEVWSQTFTGCIIEESLECKDLLRLCKISSTKVEHDNNSKTNAGEKTWTLHQVEVPRSDIEKVVHQLSNCIKLPNWWADLSFEDEIFIVFRNKVFKGLKSDSEFRRKVADYGKSLKLPTSQIPLLS